MVRGDVGGGLECSGRAKRPHGVGRGVSVALAALLLFSGCSPSAGANATAQASAQPPASNSASFGADLQRVTYDPATPGTVIAEGRDLFVQELRPRHAIRWEESVMLFPTDDSMVAWAAGLARQAGLGAGQTEKVLRYLLAVRHGYGDSPCE